MQGVKQANMMKDLKALDEWVHHLRSSWSVIRADKPLWRLHGLLHKEGGSTEDEISRAVDAVVRMGQSIIEQAKKKGGYRMKVFVVEDNPVYCKYVCNLLAREGFETETASSLSAARKLADKMKSEDTILADLRLPDGECTGLLQWMRNQGKRQRFIVMTDYAEVHTAVESMKLGSEDYIPKRLIEERLLPLVQTIRKEQERTRRAPIFRRTSEAYLSAKHRAKIVAPTNLSVMVLGENGTGKEHFAQYIHEKANGRTSRLSQWTAVHCPRHWPSPPFSDM